MNITIYILSFLLISISIIGHGYIFDKFILKIKKFDLGYLGLLGIFILTIFVYIANIIIPISAELNLIIHLTGIIFFIFFLKSNFKIKKKQFNIFAILLFFSLFFIFTAKTHDDFEYYHFAYIHLINNEVAQFGIGHFNNGFRVPSSIFYFSSLFYIPYLNHDIIHLGPIYFILFANLIFINKILNLFNKINYKFLIYLCLLGLIISNIFFYRLGEHGTDRSAQILIILLFIEIFFLLNLKNKNEKYTLSVIIILISLIISLKAFYLIYLSLIVPIVMYQKEKLKFIKNIFKLKLTYFGILFFLLILFTYFINSGCLIYPLSLSCFNVTWAIPINEVNDWNQYYQLWAKGGAAPNFRVENPDEYTKNFNWLSNWINIYFFNKVSDYLLSIVFVCLVFFIYFYKKMRFSRLINVRYKLIYLFILLFFIEWFFNHPALRYGGYHLIALIIFVPLSLYLHNINFKNKIFKKKLITFITIILLISVGRNIDRIINEYEIYNFNVFKNPSYNRNFQNFSIYDQIMEVSTCKSDCNENSIKAKRLFNRNIFYR